MALALLTMGVTNSVVRCDFQEIIDSLGIDRRVWYVNLDQGAGRSIDVMLKVKNDTGTTQYRYYRCAVTIQLVALKDVIYLNHLHLPMLCTFSRSRPQVHPLTM